VTSGRKTKERLLTKFEEYGKKCYPEGRNEPYEARKRQSTKGVAIK